MGTRAKELQFPIAPYKIRREIPARKFPSWLLLLGTGALPAGTIFSTELFFIFLGRSLFGFLLIAFMLVVITCAEVFVVVTNMHLYMEDWRWWKAFFASGSVDLYAFLYSINYLVFNLRGSSGTVSVALYLGYLVIMATAIMLSAGIIGFYVRWLMLKCCCVCCFVPA